MLQLKPEHSSGGLRKLNMYVDAFTKVIYDSHREGGRGRADLGSAESTVTRETFPFVLNDTRVFKGFS